MPLRPVPAIQRVSEKHRCPVFFRYALEHCPHFQKPILKEVRRPLRPQFQGNITLQLFAVKFPHGSGLFIVCFAQIVAKTQCFALSRAYGHRCHGSRPPLCTVRRECLHSSHASGVQSIDYRLTHLCQFFHSAASLSVSRDAHQYVSVFPM